MNPRLTPKPSRRLLCPTVLVGSVGRRGRLRRLGVVGRRSLLDDTAATLALEAGLDIKVVSDQIGHSTTRITEDPYQHVLMAVHDQGAERVVSLVVNSRAKGTGS
jgi:Phage integrase family.